MRHWIIALCALLVATPVALGGEVNINTANADMLAAELEGIGLAKANAIVEYRTTHGEFQNADELALVKGIGARTVDVNRNNIKVSDDKDD